MSTEDQNTANSSIKFKNIFEEENVDLINKYFRLKQILIEKQKSAQNAEDKNDQSKQEENKVESAQGTENENESAQNAEDNNDQSKQTENKEKPVQDTENENESAQNAEDNNDPSQNSDNKDEKIKEVEDKGPNLTREEKYQNLFNQSLKLARILIECGVEGLEDPSKFEKKDIKKDYSEMLAYMRCVSLAVDRLPEIKK